MEAYYSSSYPTSNYAYLSQNLDDAKGLRNVYSSQPHTLLHSVRKSAKPSKKVPVAPPPPKPVRVYKVDALNFRDLVQQLTGAPEFNPQNFQNVNATIANTTSLVATPPNSVSMKSEEINNGDSGLLELNLSSPSSNYNWFSNYN